MKIVRRRTKSLILLVTLTLILSLSVFLAFSQQPTIQNTLTFPTQTASKTAEDSKLGAHLQQLLQSSPPSTEYEMIIFFEKTVNYTQGITLLKDLGDFEIISNYTILNGICIKAPIGMAETIAQQNYVSSITYNEEIRLPPDHISTSEIEIKDLNVNKVIGADQLQTVEGLNGSGVVVAVLDTGIKPHTYLAGSRIIYNKSFVPYEDYSDYEGHGTAVAGIIGASGSTVTGVAPAVQFLNLKVLNAYGGGQLDWILNGINEALDGTSHPKADIISMSLGATWGSSSDDMCKAVNSAWVNNDTIVVVAAGNSGGTSYGDVYYGTINSPGLAAYIITVGATGGTDYRSISYFSSRGPTDDDGAKPDLVAPGEDITTLSDDGSGLRTGFGGTSASTPVVAGAIALLLDNGSNGMPWLSPNTVKAALMMTADDLGVNPFSQGAGLLNISSAYRYLQDYYVNENTTTPPLIITPIRAVAYPMHLWDLYPAFLKLTLVVGNVTRTPITNAYLDVIGNASAFTSIPSEVFSNLNDTQEFVSVSFKVPILKSVYDFSGNLTLYNGSGGAVFNIPLSRYDASFTDEHLSIFFWLLMLNNNVNTENNFLNASYMGMGLTGLGMVVTVSVVGATRRIGERKVPEILGLAPYQLQQLSNILVNYCPYCGTRVRAIDYFCYNCGRQIRKRPFQL